eukprot:NODE_1751_length_854_cov_40.140373_g1380_i0.p1 GENE.NODE_1751_length_854_cov_40.140373_g1380_i0~~NODE_1751_length_854_cov_40.140373_g1380_i0.p1  ORF type:complete len:132 (-),score=21.25 NODE_1751_length_854_cov_40.140373_g1380_i0:368-763(-)
MPDMDHIYRETTQQLIKSLTHKIQYSEKYCDDLFEYRHVILPKPLSKLIPKDKLLSENEWRSMGIQQSLGWEVYMTHRPEPHILLFKRSKNFDPQAAQKKHQLAMQTAAETQLAVRAAEAAAVTGASDVRM